MSLFYCKINTHAAVSAQLQHSAVRRFSNIFFLTSTPLSGGFQIYSFLPALRYQAVFKYILPYSHNASTREVPRTYEAMAVYICLRMLYGRLRPSVTPD